VGSMVAKWAGKAVLKAVVVTGGGCLIPVMILIIILMVTGIVSATTLNKKYDYEKIKESAVEEGIPPQEYLFNEIYSAASGELKFTEQELRAMVFDANSLKTMFDLIADYNNARLEKTIKVEFEGKFKVPSKYSYWADADEDGEYTKIPKATYENYLENHPEYDPYYEVEEYATKTTTKTKEITLDNTWIREKYPIDWQVVYLLCFYDSFDNGNSSTDFDINGKKIRLKKSYIEEMIEEVASEADIKEDVSADCFWVRKGSDYHALDAVHYKWGIGTVTQDEIKDYGAYKAATPFTAKVKYKFKNYTATFRGNVPISKLRSVQTLTTLDSYRTSATGTKADDLMKTTYNISKLELLLEKYGQGRSMEMFLAALEELPGGEEIAADIELARMEIKNGKEEAGN